MTHVDPEHAMETVMTQEPRKIHGTFLREKGRDQRLVTVKNLLSQTRADPLGPPSP